MCLWAHWISILTSSLDMPIYVCPLSFEYMTDLHGLLSHCGGRSLTPWARSDASRSVLCNNHPFVWARHGFIKIGVANGSIIWEFWDPTGSFMTRLPNPHKLPVRCVTYSNRVRNEHIGFSEGLQVDADFVLDPFVRRVKLGPTHKSTRTLFLFPAFGLL